MEEILLQCPLFKGMKISEITEVLEKYNHKLRTFQEKEFVILQNETCESLMVVVEGLVQAQMVDPGGKLIIIEELAVGQLLAPAFIFSDVNRMPVSVYVLKTAKILYFHHQVLLQMMQNNQIILLNFMRMISNRSRFLAQKLKFHAFMSIKEKISQYLLEEHVKQESLHIRLRHTQQELADMFGIARPSLARTFAEMEKTGIIKAINKDVEIVDIGRLRNSII